jgi:hypothetical protein
MNKQKYRIELFEEESGFWTSEVWKSKTCVYRSAIEVGDNHKSRVRERAIQYAEKQRDYGSHVVSEHYLLR